jgi:streptogramin lyase
MWYQMACFRMFDGFRARGAAESRLTIASRAQMRHARIGLCRAVVSVAAMVMFAVGCDTGPADSLYDENRGFVSDPVVDRIEPDAALAGIGTLTIFGENFSSVPSENLVFFDEVRAEIVDASQTEIVVSTPNLPREEIVVRVSVIGAEEFSNTVPYRLDPAVQRFGAITDFEEVFGLATDADGNVYISLFSSNVSAGIKRLTPEGERSDYVSSTFQWSGLGFDSDGHMYGVRNVRAVFRFPPGGGDPETWAVADNASARFRALEVDENNNVWVGGGGGNIYRITPDAELTPFPVASSVTAIDEAGGYLYLGLEGPPESRVVRHPIQPDGSLGAEEVVFTAPAGVEVLSVRVAADGSVIVGTNNEDPIYVVTTDGSSEVLYPGVLEPSALRMAWGEGSSFYVVRGRTGTTTPDLLQINTPFEGAP